jgi:chromosome segregation ATPase
VGIDKVAAFIHKTLAEINSEAMYGLHGRSQNIEIQVVRSGETIEQLQAQVIDSGDTIKQLKVHAERMEANNDELLLALQEQRKNFEAYKNDVERAYYMITYHLAYTTDICHRKSTTGRRTTAQSAGRRAWCNFKTILGFFR